MEAESQIIRISNGFYFGQKINFELVWNPKITDSTQPLLGPWEID